MSIRLVVTISGHAGKGSELLTEMEKRCVEVRTQPGCEQFEVFQSGNNPDKILLLELWESEATLREHWRKNSLTPPNPRTAALRVDGAMQREDYEYNRVM